MMSETKVEQELKRGTGLSIISLIDALVEHACEMRSSDIHFVPEEHQVRIRFRIDGVLQDMHILPKDIHPEVISRLKILTSLPTDEHQAALDGRFQTTMNGKQLDVRVSIVPTYHGENASLRLLTDQAEAFTLDTLGFSDANKEEVLKAIEKPYGMILVTGPTGSGKTTTLYTLIKMLNTKETSIITIEDPIEYAIKGVEQVQANPRTGLTFASGLRSFLRQDPNIIMVGEIRDEETADLAVQAALTGHLVFSTVHTNSAAGALPRLIDMKAEPFLLASSITAIVGQRVVRRICEACKESYVPAQAVIDDIKMTLGNLHEVLKQDGELRLYRGKGCIECGNVGYRGRMGIYEVLSTNEKIGRLIMERSDADTIERTATESGMILMKQDGYMKALEGITTLEEVLRVAQV